MCSFLNILITGSYSSVTGASAVCRVEFQLLCKGQTRVGEMRLASTAGGLINVKHSFAFIH